MTAADRMAKQKSKPKPKSPITAALHENRIVIYIILLSMIFMLCFALGFKFAVDSSITNINSASIEIAPGDRMQIFIPLGSGTAAIAGILAENEVIGSKLMFRILSGINGYDGRYKSGTHILSKYLSYEEVMSILSSNPAGVRIMFPEGSTVSSVISKLEAEKLVEGEDFRNTAESHDFGYIFEKDIPRTENRLEGYLFPDTYEFDLSADSVQIIGRMLENFDSKFTTKYYEQAKYLNMTADDIIILASLIQKEARYASEMAVISGVLHNRLNGRDGASKRLELTSTVKYIYSEIVGQPITTFDENNIQINNPYNTFIHEGLPPGPICNPGKAAIDAALNPEDTDYLYFVAKNDGTHYFSKTLEEHEAACRIYGLK